MVLNVNWPGEPKTYKEVIMQIDMHFYGVYALCRAAGLKAEISRTIAHASQFVDDAIDAEVVALRDGRGLLPTMTSHRPIDYQNTLPGDQWRVWIPFHFLPGAIHSTPKLTDRRQALTEALVCREDSSTARKMLRDALRKRNHKLWPHLIGIVSHVYADTFSHSGFLGIANDWNKVKAESIKITGSHDSSIVHYIWAKYEEFKTRFVSDFAEIVPVGHAAVATFPDRPYLKWEFEYEKDGYAPVKMKRDNPAIYMRACKKLYQFFSRFSRMCQNISDPSASRLWDDIEKPLQKLICYEAPKQDRVERWKKAIASGKFCKPTPADKKVHYNEGLWRPRRVEYQRSQELPIEQTDAYRFIQAAHEHRRYVLLELLPAAGILV